MKPEIKTLIAFAFGLFLMWLLLPKSSHKRDLIEIKKVYMDSVAHHRLLYIGAMKQVNRVKIEREKAELRTREAIAERDKVRLERKKQQQHYENILRNYTRHTPASLDSAVRERYGYTR